MSHFQRIAFFVFLGTLTFLPASHAALLNQVDDFQIGSTHGWGADQQDVIVVTNGGPAGAGDRYLAYFSHGGAGAGGRMVIPNETDGNQWQGDYTSLGAKSIVFDISNRGNAPLELRLAISNGTTWFATSTAHLVAPTATWTSIAFQLSEPAMSVLGSGSESLSQVLGGVTKLRLLSSVNLPTVSFGGTGNAQGDKIVGTIGFDNVRFGIPEPSGLSLLMLASATFLRLRNRTAC